ncbi:hypothetical protein ERJ75_001074500 [Trypanosoma vivax]|nr:hypothetical protein ERJ75_001074500 [Trypanosoma vivax]
MMATENPTNAASPTPARMREAKRTAYEWATPDTMHETAHNNHAPDNHPLDETTPPSAAHKGLATMKPTINPEKRKPLRGVTQDGILAAMLGSSLMTTKQPAIALDHST